VNVLHESGSLLLSIINDLLDMTKIEADQLELEQVAFDIRDMAQRLEAVHTLKAAEKKLSLGVQLLGAETGLRLGDPYRLLQILHNLIGNAIKFTHQGSVTVEIDCRSAERILLDVRDTGIGMTPEAAAVVFEDFGQADNTIARRFGGTGLGMPIVKRLVAMMDGTIRLDTQPGLGTRVRIELPLRIAQPGDQPSAASVVPTGLPDLSALRVLAADDNRTNRMILGAMLGQLGVSATMVADGHGALRTFEEERFDVVILDISMPDIDGIEVMKTLRARLGSRQDPPAILAFTANAMAHQVDGYLKAGFDACLTKPLQLPSLAAALLATKGGRAAASAAEGRRATSPRPATPAPVSVAVAR
jgi:CheY-like chemotaxis protein